ncbi:adenosylcobinamide amidohydrolase [Allosaccharopolyspora coralli]|uniref:Adenosylcobinamide amidohydrolase n=1 Tax=Allosaccharopolyspora coralli TaxID=2665642 RepID=A0A5Q3Q6Y0_9PSEU|nr:adenosylcobinamide amidohydrolase [Allosaccharopolyspora coralli]QGK69600.1 adenosylcobinamide amidohydrolase [Allosaccharopolyspora coralli]
MSLACPAPQLRVVDEFPLLVWRCPLPWLAISSGVRGGGLGLRHWVLNATVVNGYSRDDPAGHVDDLAAVCGLSGSGTGLLTAVDVRNGATVTDCGVTASVTTGIGAHATWAASGDDVLAVGTGTINAVVWLPVRLSESALVNAVATVAEAKAQALAESAVPGTGTPTDATVVLCPTDGPAEPYGGPRSRIGAPLARAVHGAVAAGIRGETAATVDGQLGTAPRGT